MTVHVIAFCLILGLWLVLPEPYPWKLRWWFRAGLLWMVAELVAWRQMETAIGRWLWS